MRIGAILVNRFAEKKKTCFFLTFEPFARIASNPRNASFSAPKCDSQERGPVREPSSNSRESSDSRECANRGARIGPSKYHPGRNYYKIIPETIVGGSLVGGMERLGVWNCIFFGLFRSLKFGKNRSFCGVSGIFLQISASEKYFSDSGKWPFHTPPIHTPTKCRPIWFLVIFCELFLANSRVFLQ